MNSTELKMNTAEIALIKNKVKKAKIFMVVFITLFAILLWFWTDKETPYSTFKNGLSIFLVVLLLIFIVAFSKKLLVTGSDIKNQIKIIDELKVIEKHLDSSRSSSYYIVFNSEIFKKYEVKKEIYDMINITDSVYIEYSKYANWILKIEHNGKDIENKNMIA
jgi:hypothetical protein